MQIEFLKPGLRSPYRPESLVLLFIILLAAGSMQASAAHLTVEKSTVCEGSWVNASFVLPYEEDQPQGETDDGGYGRAAFYDLNTGEQVGGTVYINNGEGEEVKMSLRAPHKLGPYEFRLFRDPFTSILLARAAVEVTACPPAGAYVDTPRTVCVGQLANITVWLPVEEDDRFDGSGFAALYRVGTDEEIGGTRSGVNDNCMGSCEPRPVRFPLTYQIPPGDYEWRMFGDYYGAFLLQTYPVQVINCTSPDPQACGRLALDLEEEEDSVVVARVVDACENKPLQDAILEIRIFHTYDAQLDEAINGEYVDVDPRLTDQQGEARIQVDGKPGDIYRVDVYASKEGWGTSDRSIHVTIGEDGSLRFPQLGNRIEVNEIGQYSGQWTRIEGTDTFAASWNGGQLTDVIEIVSVEGDQITLYRKGIAGYYYGVLHEDGTITGTASWYEQGWTWSGTITN